MFRRIVLLAGGALAALALSVAPAQATGGATTDGGAGSVWFESYGEHFTVNDWAADGHGVRGEIQELRRGPGGQDKYFPLATVYNGNGYHGPAEHRNLSIPEDRPIKYRACMVDGKNDSTPFNCSSWKYDKA